MQVLDSFIDAALVFSDEREGDELIGMIVRYLRTGAKPEPRTEAQRAVLCAIRPSLENSKARCDAGRRGMESRWGSVEVEGTQDNKPDSKADNTPDNDADNKDDNNAINTSDNKPDNKPYNTPDNKGDNKRHNKPDNKPDNKPPKNAITKRSKEEEKERTPPYGGVRKKAPPLRPKPDEVDEYARSQGYTHFDSARFCDYYEAQGWHLSNGNAMKNWQAAVRNWVRQDKAHRSTHEFPNYD